VEVSRGFSRLLCVIFCLGNQPNFIILHPPDVKHFWGSSAQELCQPGPTLSFHSGPACIQRWRCHNIRVFDTSTLHIPSKKQLEKSMESLHPQKLTWHWLENHPWMRRCISLQEKTGDFPASHVSFREAPSLFLCQKNATVWSRWSGQVFGMVVQATDLPNREMIGLSDPLPGCVVNFEPGSH